MRMSAPCASMQHVDALGGGSLQPLDMCVLSSTEVLSSADIVWHRTRLTWWLHVHEDRVLLRNSGVCGLY